jgi:cell division initiation protein
MTPYEIQNKTFGRSMNGYRAEEVHQFLAEVSAQVSSLISERDDMLEKMSVLAEKLEEYRADEESLRAALIGAQKLGDSVVREAKDKAKAILEEAKKQAEVAMTGVNRSIELETYALEKKKLEAAKFKKQLLNLYQQHIDVINALPYDEDTLPKIESVNVTEHAQITQPSEREGEVFDEGDVEQIQLDYEDVPEDEAAFPKRKSKFGTLRFGEGYDLKREE